MEEHGLHFKISQKLQVYIFQSVFHLHNLILSPSPLRNLTFPDKKNDINLLNIKSRNVYHKHHHHFISGFFFSYLQGLDKLSTTQYPATFCFFLNSLVISSQHIYSCQKYSLNTLHNFLFLHIPQPITPSLLVLVWSLFSISELNWWNILNAGMIGGVVEINPIVTYIIHLDVCFSMLTWVWQICYWDILQLITFLITVFEEILPCLENK